ncbi:MAG: type II toxin-antitoxin system Phd/YefM family antitoxin [Chloroflexi bacterium]|nr:type II toxin-antitoxin system Phd/YefM family antitoxin [Chloroflexota bacterium]
MTSISIARAKTHLDALVGRVAAGERIMIRQRNRAVAVLISASELERLEHLDRTVRQSARALGQRAELLEQIQAGKIHPAMAAFGLWRDEPELENLTEQIYTNRKNQGARAEVAW